MPKDHVERKLYYLRARWSDGVNHSLQDVLRQAHAACETTAKRTFAFGDSELRGQAVDDQNGLHRVHVGRCVPGQQASTLAQPSSAQSADTGVYDPPARSDYMDGDAFMVVRGNHVVMCPSFGLREGVLVRYVQDLFMATGHDSLIPVFHLEPVTNLNTADIIAQEGVKTLILDSSLYEATMRYEKRARETTHRNCVAEKAKEFLEHLGIRFDDIDPEADDHDPENIQVRLELRYSERRKGGELGGVRMSAAAATIVAEDDPESQFKIVTGNN